MYQAITFANGIWYCEVCTTSARNVYGLPFYVPAFEYRRCKHIGYFREQ